MIPYCQHEIREADEEAVSKVLGSSRLTQGPAVAGFERSLCDRIGAPCAVAVSSGTSALQLGLAALGVGEGDEVIVPSLTFLATANAVLLNRATPVFADIDSETLMLDPEDVARRAGPRTRGAILVHYAGHAGDVDALRSALGPGRFVIEDACHALGAEDHGEPIGARSELACFSFHPAKHITTGEGGAILTSRDDLAAACVRLREHGVERNPQARRGLGLPESLRAEETGSWVYEMHALSANHRLPDLGAALGTSQLSRLDDNLSRRRAIADRYRDAFGPDERIALLPERMDTRSAWHLYPIRLREGKRAEVHARLHEDGVGVQVHYIPIHLQPWYRERFGTQWGDLPATEAAYLMLLSMPMFPTLSRSDQDRSIDALFRALECKAR